MTHGSLDHVLLTRFNVPTPGRESLVRAQEGWLRNRIQLFETHCLPSVLAQTTHDFKWIVYFDPASPEWFREWLSKADADHTFHAIFRESISRDEMLSDLRSVTGATRTTLLTTNLDNDDGLAVDFVERLQDAVSPGARQALYFPTGIILRGTETFLRTDRRNAFCSVAESWDEPVMAWAEWHNRLDRIMPAREIAGGPAWLQVVHDLNVSNTVHGRLVRPDAYAWRFPASLSHLPQPAGSRFALDATLHRPARVTRSMTRSVVKTAVLWVTGPKGLDTLKYEGARVRHRLQQVALLRRAGVDPTDAHQSGAVSHGTV